MKRKPILTAQQAATVYVDAFNWDAKPDVVVMSQTQLKNFMVELFIAGHNAREGNFDNTFDYAKSIAKR